MSIELRSVFDAGSLAAEPVTQRDAVAAMLPKAADAYCRMVGLVAKEHGFTKNLEAAAQARTVLRQLAGASIKLVPMRAEGERRAHVEALFNLQRMALLAPPPVGSGSAPIGSVVAGAGFGICLLCLPRRPHAR
jgi:hypothetical protein